MKIIIGLMLVFSFSALSKKDISTSGKYTKGFFSGFGGGGSSNDSSQVSSDDEKTVSIDDKNTVSTDDIKRPPIGPVSTDDTKRTPTGNCPKYEAKPFLTQESERPAKCSDNAISGHKVCEVYIKKIYRRLDKTHCLPVPPSLSGVSCQPKVVDGGGDDKTISDGKKGAVASLPNVGPYDIKWDNKLGSGSVK